MSGVELTVLGNGLRVVSHHMPQVETVTLGLWVGSGSRHEAKEMHGISHFLEHMAFKGSRKRSAKRMAEEIEDVGGELNAHTDVEATAYYARVLGADVGLAVGLIAEMLLDPALATDDIERERNVILQEIAATADRPEDQVFDLFLDAAFPGQPLGRPILGTGETVERISASHLRDHLERHYRGPAMVLGAAGAIAHQQLVRHAEALFGGVNGASAPAGERARYAGGVRTHARPFEQVHVIAGYEAPGYLDGSHFPALALAGILGGGASSRLFQQAREARGLCYTIEAFTWGHVDTGLFGIRAATAPESRDELLAVMAEETQAMIEGKLTVAEVARARAQLRVGLLMSLESTGARAEQIALQTLIHGAPLTTEAILGQIDAITPATVHQVAQRVFRDSPPVFAEIGPGAGQPNGRDGSKVLRVH